MLRETVPIDYSKQYKYIQHKKGQHLHRSSDTKCLESKKEKRQNTDFIKGKKVTQEDRA